MKGAPEVLEVIQHLTLAKTHQTRQIPRGRGPLPQQIQQPLSQRPLVRRLLVKPSPNEKRTV